jgi:hypothetical protein
MRANINGPRPDLRPTASIDHGLPLVELLVGFGSFVM